MTDRNLVDICSSPNAAGRDDRVIRAPEVPIDMRCLTDSGGDSGGCLRRGDSDRTLGRLNYDLARSHLVHEVRRPRATRRYNNFLGL
jgi:hypothetical protein